MNNPEGIAVLLCFARQPSGGKGGQNKQQEPIPLGRSRCGEVPKQRGNQGLKLKNDFLRQRDKVKDMVAEPCVEQKGQKVGDWVFP